MWIVKILTLAGNRILVAWVNQWQTTNSSSAWIEFQDWGRTMLAWAIRMEWTWENDLIFEWKHFHILSNFYLRLEVKNKFSKRFFSIKLDFISFALAWNDSQRVKIIMCKRIFYTTCGFTQKAQIKIHLTWKRIPRQTACVVFLLYFNLFFCAALFFPQFVIRVCLALSCPFYLWLILW